MTTNKEAVEFGWLRVWIAIGSIGLLLTGIGMVASLPLYGELADLAKEIEESPGDDQEDFGEAASELYDTGRLTELESRIAERQRARPNDGEVFWWSARLRVAKGEYSEALKQLDKVQLHAPTWTVQYVQPLREAIERSQDASQ